MDLAQKNCVPCEGGTSPLAVGAVAKYLDELDLEWENLENRKIRREFKFENFKEAMAFMNKVAALAESEGHHPDIHIFYNRVVIELSTHAVKGLSENDFIMARKIEVIK